MPVPDAAKDRAVAVNEVLLTNAELVRSARSLLDNFAAGERDDAAVDHDLEDELELVEASETSGLGFVEPPAVDGVIAGNSQTSTATEKLRKQMLGQRPQARSPDAAGTAYRAAKLTMGVPSKPRPRPVKTRGGDESDEEEGRSRLGGRSRKQIAGHPGPQKASQVSIAESKKRGTSYIDEILASRASKKKKTTARQEQRG